jgi:hypothetical protein
MAKRTITIQYEPLPTKTVMLTDWEAVLRRLDAGEEPVYEMTASLTRALYIHAQRKRGYVVYYKSVADGIVKLSKKPSKNPAQPGDKRLSVNRKKGQP